MDPRVLDIELPHKYSSRDYQDDFWDAWHGEGVHAGKEYLIYVKVWHRRGGKDVTDWNAAIEATAEDNMSTLYGFPTSDMARNNLWEAYTNDGMRFTDFCPIDLRIRRNKSDDGLNDSLKRIELITGGSIRVVSTHNPDRLRGGNSKLFVLSEFQAMDPRVIDIIMPIIRMNGGRLLINMTANGDSAAKVLLEYWKTREDVYVSEVTIEDSGLLSAEQMEDIFEETKAMFRARGQSEEEAIAFVRQEYYCDWSAPVIGSYFGSAMRRADDEGRITRVPHEELLPVETWWDLGVDDSMSIWFVQLFNREIRLIDYYENSGEGFAHYSRVLKGQIEGLERMKYYNYGRHLAPHDIKVRNMGEDARTRLEVAKGVGIKFTAVKRVSAKEDGIEAIRSILSRCWFDAKNCSRGISALKGYRKEYNDVMQVYNDKPVHDWTSHGTDAFQTGALTNPTMARAEEGGRVTRTATYKGQRHQTTYATPDGKQVLNLDFRKAYRGKRR
jgi:phage terminase large subunit